MAEIVIRIGEGVISSIQFEVSDEVAKGILTQLVDKSFITDSDSKTNPVSSAKKLILPDLPTFNEIDEFIKSQVDYKHSVEAIALNFAKRKVESSEGNEAKLWLNAVRSTTNRVRKEIQDQEGGEWTFENRDRQRIFTFIKKEGDQKGQLRQASIIPDSREDTNEGNMPT